MYNDFKRIEIEVKIKKGKLKACHDASSLAETLLRPLVLQFLIVILLVLSSRPVFWSVGGSIPSSPRLRATDEEEQKGGRCVSSGVSSFPLEIQQTFLMVCVFNLDLCSTWIDLNLQFDWRRHLTRVSLRRLEYLD